MLGLMKKLFASNEKEVKKLFRIVEEVNSLEEEVMKLSDDAMAEKTREIRERLQNGETEDDVLPEAFALVREASRRALDMRPFDVQVLGGIVLHQGRVAEMKTGEGKTLAATMPAYLNALNGKGVHVVTVNDYLAERDSKWMGPVYRLLGLEVGLIINDTKPAQRREAYRADIVYGTNNEFGFDYLRDNLAIRKEEQVQNDYNFAIVDEADSILIDEARTPLIISGKVEGKHEYGRWKLVVDKLVKKQWRQVNDILNEAAKKLQEGEKEEAAELLYLAGRGAPKNKKFLKMLKEQGMEKQVERVKNRLKIEKRDKEIEEQLFFHFNEVSREVYISEKGYTDLAREDHDLATYLGFANNNKDNDDEPDEPDVTESDETDDFAEGEPADDESERRGGEHEFTIRTLLRAYALYEKDVDYVVQDGKVIIVDEFTGRLMPGRRYSEGLHQAIEAREGVAVQADTRTVASITYQNYFRMYNKISGMTGTAATEETEFRDIYGMDVVVIPTHREMIRQDNSDRIYKTMQAKFRAVVDEIAEVYEKGQPVLVGTISVERSEFLSRMLKRRGIPHQVLNAVNHEKEAHVIAQAGRKGMVTISTNMAGRGTDIILGGNYEQLADEAAAKKLEGQTFKNQRKRDEEFRRLKQELLQQEKVRREQEYREVVEKGGLFVIGTERHESRRIDNQLRGRAGRQGDPGASRFYVSLEDDLMRLFGSDTIAAIMDRLGMDEEQVIEYSVVGRGIENAQKKVEYRNFEIRKYLLSYDEVLNEQRRVIYEQRQKVLDGEDLRETIAAMINRTVERTAARFIGDRRVMEEDQTIEMLKYGETSFLRAGRIRSRDLSDMSGREAGKLLQEEAQAFYEEREKKMGPEFMRELERVIILRTVDRFWVEHIDAMHELRHEVSGETAARMSGDPLVTYRRRAFNEYEMMLEQVETDVVRAIFYAQVFRPDRNEKGAPEKTKTDLLQRHEVVSAATAVRPGEANRQFAADGESFAGGQKKQQPVKVEEKVGRNAPCSCGSGRKYKKCCGRAE